MRKQERHRSVGLGHGVGCEAWTSGCMSGVVLWHPGPMTVFGYILLSRGQTAYTGVCEDICRNVTTPLATRASSD